VTTYRYDDVGNVDYSLSTAGDTVKQLAVSYDPLLLRPITITGPTGLSSNLLYSADTGQSLTEIDPNGVATLHVYDFLHRQVAEITPTETVTTALGQSTQSGASYAVRRTSTDHAQQARATMVVEAHFDSRGHKLVEWSSGLDGTVIEQRREFSPQGLLLREELPHVSTQTAEGSTGYVYDILGSLRSITTPGDEGEPPIIESYDYATAYTLPAGLFPTDPVESSRFSFVAQKTDADGNVNLTFSGGAQRPIMRRQGQADDRAEMHLVYGALGKVRELHGANNVLSTAYDEDGRVSSIADSDVGTISYTYDGFDRVRTMTDGDGRTTTYTYDALDRLTLAEHPESNEQFFFDQDPDETDNNPQMVNSLGHLVRAERHTLGGANYTETFRYESQTGDPLTNRGLLESIDLGGPDREMVTSYEYYPGTARVYRQHYPLSTNGSSFGVQYCYDSVGSLTHVFDERSGADCLSPNATAAPYWRRTRVKNGMAEDEYALSNGITVSLDLDPATYRLQGHSIDATNASVGFQYDYEASGKLRESIRSGALGQVQEFAYKASGVLDSVKRDGQVIFSPTYSAAMQLEAGPSTLGTFSYQGADSASLGNRLKRVEPGPGQAAPTTFDYDGRGNQTLRQGPTIPGGQQAIEYNDFNLPDEITTGLGSAQFRVRFDYDASGQRVHTFRSDEEIWHFPGIFEHEERSNDLAAAEVDRYWVYAHGSRIAQVERSRAPNEETWTETTEFFHYDRAGSIIAMSDATGNITAEFDYDTYGSPKQTLGSEFGYTGHRHEQDIGLIDTGGRFYDPQFGIFLSPDPVSPLGGGSPRMNRYAYVGYDPVNFVDPTGRFVVPLMMWAVQAFGGAAFLATLPMGLNWLTTGHFSYDWSKDTWERVGIMAASIGAGLGCGLAGGPILGAMCAGLVGGTLGGLQAGRSFQESLGMGLAGMGLAAFGAGLGVMAGAIVLDGTNSYFAMVYARVAATTGSSLGFQAAMGGEIKWAQVGAEAAVSLALATMEAQEAKDSAAASGTAAGKGYTKASRPDHPFRLAQGPVDKALGTLEPGTGPLLGYVQDSQGQVRGALHVIEYNRTAAGARLVLRFDDVGSEAEKLNWLQTVVANGPQDTGEPFLDNQHWANGTAFYLSKSEVDAFSFDSGRTLYFLDTPQRGLPTQWTAELSLVGQFSGSPHYDPLITVSWGFTRQGTLLPVQMTPNPSQFHLGQIP
jgi:RHS repeat-associated protein